MTCPICDSDSDQVRVIHPGKPGQTPLYLGTWCSCGCLFDDTETTPDGGPRVLAVVKTTLTQAEVEAARKDYRKKNLTEMERDT